MIYELVDIILCMIRGRSYALHIRYIQTVTYNNHLNKLAPSILGIERFQLGAGRKTDMAVTKEFLSRHCNPIEQ